MRILVAEDGAPLAGFARQGLRAEQATVDVAEDGETARTLGSGVDDERVILDLKFPGSREWPGEGADGCAVAPQPFTERV